MPKKLFRYLIFFIILMIAGFGYGYFKTFLSLRDDNDIKRSENIDYRNAGKMQEITLKSGANMIYITSYTGCNHETKQETPLDNMFAGFTKQQLENVVGEWKIESFTPDEVVLKRRVSGVCDEHYYIGLNDGYVTLFRGIPGLQSEVVDKTDIMADTLREEDRAMLEKGIVIKDREEFLKIKEGLTN